MVEQSLKAKIASYFRYRRQKARLQQEPKSIETHRGGEDTSKPATLEQELECHQSEGGEGTAWALQRHQRVRQRRGQSNSLWRTHRGGEDTSKPATLEQE